MASAATAMATAAEGKVRSARFSVNRDGEDGGWVDWDMVGRFYTSQYRDKPDFINSVRGETLTEANSGKPLPCNNYSLRAEFSQKQFNPEPVPTPRGDGMPWSALGHVRFSVSATALCFHHRRLQPLVLEPATCGLLRQRAPPHPPALRRFASGQAGRGCVAEVGVPQPCCHAAARGAQLPERVVGFRAAQGQAKRARLTPWRKSSPAISTTTHISCRRERMRSPMRSPSVSSRTAARTPLPSSPPGGRLV